MYGEGWKSRRDREARGGNKETDRVGKALRSYRLLPPSLMTSVRPLDPTEWKKRTNAESGVLSFSCEPHMYDPPSPSGKHI